MWPDHAKDELAICQLCHFTSKPFIQHSRITLITMKQLSRTNFKCLSPWLIDSPSRAAVHSRGGPVLCRGRQDVWSSPRSLGSGTTSKHWWWNGRDHARINWLDCQEIRYESNSICQTGTPLITGRSLLLHLVLPRAPRPRIDNWFWSKMWCLKSAFSFRLPVSGCCRLWSILEITK